jgi:hypothetical protein
MSGEDGSPSGAPNQSRWTIVVTWLLAGVALATAMVGAAEIHMLRRQGFSSSPGMEGFAVMAMVGLLGLGAFVAAAVLQWIRTRQLSMALVGFCMGVAGLATGLTVMFWVSSWI